MNFNRLCLFIYLYIPNFLYATFTNILPKDGEERRRDINFTLLSLEIIANYPYKNIEYLASGGYSYIFKATDVFNGETVVIKIPKSEKDQISLPTEKEFLDNCDHPNIIKCNREIEINNKSCLVLPFYEDTLESVFLNDSLDDNDIRFILKQILDALKHLHSKGKIHNDIKRNNILLKDKKFVKIIDFGLSCRTNELINIFEGYDSNEIEKIPDFYSPEMKRNEPLNEKSDMWSLGYIVKYLKQKIRWISLYEEMFKSSDYSNFVSCFLNNEAEKRISASTALMSNFFEGFYEFMYCFCKIKDQSFSTPGYTFFKLKNRIHINYYEYNIIIYCGCSIEAKNFCSEKIVQAKTKDISFFNSDNSQYFNFGVHCTYMIKINSAYYLLCELNVFELENLSRIFKYFIENILK
ncbi:protein kinase [Hamiltosporidium magnivora]|uniref:Protein kinase n=2 Tax=Hamiltosporidium magnivora TaxID=148818 RepID=A0A4Q9LLL8_9MICR|nr:protein kinase [Hamiltosporidium magnivora]